MKLNDYLKVEHNETEVLSLINEDYHENFGYQWTRFDKLQLDSFNGSNESKERLLFQSELSEIDFRGKTILEVGAGNGRFTEILLKLGAKVIAIDFSTAIYSNFNNHLDAIKNGDLLCIRADVFNLPIKKSLFDIVICYGVIQHTGNNELCLRTLASYVKKGGILLVDIYSNSFKHYNPMTYAIRPFFSRIRSNTAKMEAVEKFVNFLFPFQLKALKFLHNKGGIFKLLKYFINRSPNSVYGINLYLDNKISIENAKNWSICDTYDAWTPKHDNPVSLKKWTKLLKELERTSGFTIHNIKECGQGNCATLQKN